MSSLLTVIVRRCNFDNISPSFLKPLIVYWKKNVTLAHTQSSDLQVL